MQNIISKSDLILGGRNYGKVSVTRSHYMDNRQAGTAQPALVIEGFEKYAGERIADATAYLGVVGPSGDCTLIKDYSENEGIFDWLIAEGVIEAYPGWDTDSGFVTLKGAKIVHPQLELELDDEDEIA